MIDAAQRDQPRVRQRGDQAVARARRILVAEHDQHLGCYAGQVGWRQRPLRPAQERDQPGTFRRLALLGIGRGVLEPADPEPIVAVLTSEPDPENVSGMVFRRLADGLGNDRAALIAFLRRPQRPLTPVDLARITTQVLVVLGDQDPAGTLTSGDGLVAALPDARLVTLRGVDHFGTPADVRCMQAVLGFLGC